MSGSSTSGPSIGAGEVGRRWLIATAVARHTRNPEWDRPGLVAAREEMIALFTGTLRYEHVDVLGLNPTRAQLTAKLRRFGRSEAVGPRDMLAVYLGCHGELLDDGEHVLITADTDPDDLDDALPTAELARKILKGTRVRRLLLMLDACYSGRGGNELAATALTRMTDRWTPEDNAGLVVMTSALPADQAMVGAFPALLREAIAAEATAGHAPSTLALDAVVAAMNANPRRPGFQHVGLDLGKLTGRIPPFLPNPRHDPTLTGVDLVVQQAAEWRAQADQEELAYRATLLRRAMGSHDAPGGGWWFTGRHTALREITAWLAAPDRARPLLAVTGDPGSGKTAVLGLVATLAHPNRRRTVPLDTLALPAAAVPAIGALDAVVYVQGLTAEQVLRRIAAAARTDATTVGGLLDHLADRLRPLTVLLDGLDEAAAPHDLTGRLLAPLTEHAQGRVRLLVGTRPHLLPHLVPGLDRARAVDLDADRYADPAAMTAYTVRGLLGATVGSPYRHLPRQQLLAVAQAVVEAAHPSFLVARITAATLAAQPPVTDPTDPAWLNGLPRLPGAAMQRDLDTRLGAEAARARDLLLPLAFAQGQGMPWEDVWAPLASYITGRLYTDEDLLWLRDHAGSYVVENSQDERSVYRLYHQALVEHLRDGVDDRAVHSAFVDVLLDRVPVAADARTDWTRAHPYTRTHLATHAAAAARVDELITDPEYLVHADPDTLLPALRHTTTDAAVRTRAIYRNTVHRDLAPHQRRLTLAIDATRFGDTTLATELAHNLPWRPRWATGTQTSTAHRATLTGHTEWVLEVACIEIDGRPVAVTRSYDGTVRVWDLADATLRNTLTRHTRAVSAVACIEVHGRAVAVTGSNDGTVRVWNLADGTLRHTFTGHTGPVNAVACTKLIRWPVAVTGGVDGTVRVWDLADGTLRNTLTGHTRPVSAVACTKIDGWPVAVTGGVDGTVRVWDLADATLRNTLTGQTRPVSAVACTKIDGHPVIATGSNDGTVGVWDLVDGTLRNTFTGHTGPVNAVACTQIDRRPVAVTGSHDETVRVWDLWETESQAAPATDRFDTSALACTEIDGRPVAITGSDDGTVRVWNLADGTLRNTLTGHTDSVNAVACTQIDGRPFAVTGDDDGTIRVWDLAAATSRNTFTRHTGPVNAVACTQIDGRPFAVTGGVGGTIRVWSLADGTLPNTLTGQADSVNAVACTQIDGHPVAVTGSHDGTVRVWDLADGTLRNTLTRHTRPVSSVACTQIDGHPVAVTGSHDGTVRVWDLADGTLRNTLTGHTRSVSAVACTQIDGHPVAITAGNDTVWVWQLNNGQGELLFRQNGIRALATTPNAEIVNSTGWDLVVTHAIAGQPRNHLW